jgi:bifunctional ADP-heptose synthase (sugar kinase/adenylyltransferase)
VTAAQRALRGLRVLVVGEAIVDEYRYVRPLGAAPKDAMLSVLHLRDEAYAGGALACANHVRAFCDDVHVLTCLGGAESGEALIRGALAPGVALHALLRPGAPTITKCRYVVDPSLVKLFEVVSMDDAPLPPDLEERLLEELDRLLPAFDVVIVADFGHGLLGQRAATLLAERARFLAVTTQANAANRGFSLATKYPRASYVCLDEPELRLAMQDRWSPVIELAEKLRGLLGCQALAVTRGAQGAVTCSADGGRWEIPALAGGVVDRMGAGDCYLAVTAPCVAAGLPVDVVGLVGTVAGALAVRSVGNRAVDPAALHREIARLLA